jgi:hypothetical protein
VLPSNKMTTLLAHKHLYKRLTHSMFVKHFPIVELKCYNLCSLYFDVFVMVTLYSASVRQYYMALLNYSDTIYNESTIEKNADYI